MCQSLAIGSAIFVAIVAVALGLSLLKNTVVAWWVPVLAALTLATATLPLTRRRLSDWLGGRVWGVCAHMVVVGSLSFALFLGVNFWGATSTEIIDGTVVAKVRQEHTRYRRSGRRVRVADGTYHTWHVRVRCGQGEFLSPSMDYGRYRRMRVGAKVPVELGHGLLGYKTIRLAPRKKNLPNNKSLFKNKCEYVGLVILRGFSSELKECT